MNDVTKIIKSLEDSVVLIEAATKTVKHEIKKQKGRFLGALLVPLGVSLVQPVISSVVKNIGGRGVTEQEEDIWMKIFAPSFNPIQDGPFWGCSQKAPRP